jgi:hypothetical protein
VSVSHISIDNNIIPRSNLVRNLGLWIDPTLSFSEHISKVRSKSFMSLRMISRIRKFLTSSRHKMLINSLVFSNIKYCVSLFHAIPKSEIQRLQNIMDASIRSIYRLKKSLPIADRFKSHKWLNVKQRSILRLAIILFKAIRFKRPLYLHNILSERDCGVERVLRSTSQQLLDIPRSRTNLGSRAFRVCGPSIWNSLPLAIREQTFLRFKKDVAYFLLGSDSV